MGNPVFERKRGVIKTVLHAKQYGFIHVSDKEEYFFHSTAIQPGVKFSELVAGDAVSFIPTPGKEGKLRAVGIRRLYVDPAVGSDSTPVAEGAVPEAAGRVHQQGSAEQGPDEETE